MKTSGWIVSSCVLSLPATAQPAPPDYGFDFVTVGDVGNTAYDGFDGGGRIAGRGSVGYEYRIARTELRTSQFVEFMNVLGELAPQTALLSTPLGWGAVTRFNPDGTVRFELDRQLPDAGDIGVYGISWRLGAIYCNWLHNDKGRTLDDLNFGSYDASTFMQDPKSANLLDQTTRNPDARYWIPSLDEWLKAAHYDPDKNGEGEGGWWQYTNGTDEPLTPGLPGEPGAETSYQLDLPNFNELTIPIGSYPETQSPWGLLDVSGGAAEWTETYLPDVFQTSRIYGGSVAGPDVFLLTNEDRIDNFGAESLVGLPGGPQGIRIASAVPSPGSTLLLGFVCAAGGTRRRRTVAVALLAASTVSTVNAQPAPPDYGFDFVTIGDTGNDAYNGLDLGSTVTGRGSVGYDYRIARFETRTSQFMEFMNTLGRLSPQDAIFQAPGSWGGVGFVNGDGTVRFELANSPTAADQPVIGIGWRLSAVYCNWLHNDKGQTLDDLNFGAYDTSTFMTDPDNPPNLTDQAMRSPDARYWIPSLDEWLKAAHYDPDKDGPGQGGWWQYPNGTDQPLAPGLPGEPGAQTSYQLDMTQFDERTIPVGAFPDVQSPYGLLDVSGGAAEWTETYQPDVFQLTRFFGGSVAGPNPFVDLGVNQDVIWRVGAESPTLPLGSVGIRIASAVPSPASASLVGITLIAGGARRRRTAGLPSRAGQAFDAQKGSMIPA